MWAASYLNESVDSTHYLGVSIINDLCWNTHINQTTVKANRS